MSTRETDPRPNIIWIMSDDLSWGDLGCYGQEKIATPNIDALAEAGTRFTQAYCGSPICAPSRSTLMQGLHSGHATVRANMMPVEGGRYRHSLQAEDITVAECLHAAGYATGMFGKWGLALQDQPGRPLHKGFETFVGYLNQRRAHSYYPQWLWNGETKMEYPQHDGWHHHEPRRYDENGRIVLDMMKDPDRAQYSFDVYAEASRQWVRENAHRPFFLYLPYTIPHGALCVPELGRYTDLDWPDVRHKEWAAMITRMDDEIGRLVALLKDLDVFDNTLILFCSDNGYSARGYVKEEEEPPTFDEFFGHSGPFRGGKGNLNEGGLRVPMIAHWPGHVPAGQVCDQPWAFYDFFPTACELAGAKPPSNLDGVSIAPYLRGEGNVPEREFFYWEFCESFKAQQAVRMGPWKAFRAHPGEPTELYAIEDDPGEQNDLAAEHPDVVRRAEELFEQEHVQSPIFCDPGEDEAAWRTRMRREGCELRDNLEF